MDSKEIKIFLRKWFSEIADKDCSNCSLTCNLSSKCGDSPKYTAWKNGYSPNDLEKVPPNSILGLGCRNPFNFLSLKKGQKVLILESKAGMDAFLASKKVGSEGKVIGIDMTPEMVERSKNIALEYGYTNVEFKVGELDSLPIEDQTIDIVIANGAINLYLDKIKVLKEAYRVIKDGSWIIVSDLITTVNLPVNIAESLDAWAMGIAGALKKNEYIDKLEKSGFKTIKIISQKPYAFDIYPSLRGKITSLQIQAQKLK